MHSLKSMWKAARAGRVASVPATGFTVVDLGFMHPQMIPFPIHSGKYPRIY